MLYGLETVSLRKRQESELEVAELKMLRAQDKQTVEVVSMSRSQGNYEEEQGRRPPVQKAVLFMAGYVTRCVFLTRHGFTALDLLVYPDVLKMECTLGGSLRLPLLVLLSGVSLGVVDLEMVPQHGGSPALKNITLAVILPLHNTEYPWAWPRVGPALNWAVEKVNSDPTLLPGYRMRLVFSSSENKDGVCSDSVAPLVAVDLKFAHDPWAFIGPGCDYASSPVARFTTHWEVPMVTAGAPALGFNMYFSHHKHRTDT
ncbi:hypothetical protein QTP86_034409 [Hemibagrus guttatus]|nr:hypothetical protein QTP86_034409 [Hemibagrus guttatus]